jgi:hypothetical protein
MWIPWTVGLTRKHEIFLIADLMHVSNREAAAGCMEVWEFAGNNCTASGRLVGVTCKRVSDQLGNPGICESMKAVGWIEENGGLTFKNFERWNGRTAKERMQAAIRMKRKRAGEK